jgi:hypothetical protein
MPAISIESPEFYSVPSVPSVPKIPNEVERGGGVTLAQASLPLPSLLLIPQAGVAGQAVIQKLGRASNNRHGHRCCAILCALYLSALRQ